jgi:hypothetical protein
MDNATRETIRRKQQEIIDLIGELTSPVSKIGDYRVIKCYEATLSGAKTMPYDTSTLLAERQKVRDKINALQAEVAQLEAEQ